MEQQVASGPAAFAPLLMMLLVLAVFYFILIRPQRKKEKKLREMIANLRVGDEVASIGGIRGKIVRVKDDVFVLESGVGTTKSFISLERSAISRLIKEGSSKEKELEPLPDEPQEMDAADTTEEK
ncbi:preprotein translocase subunit YajC [Ructibacterium gallinarum]|uniref:Preprotein translocase subunit YajC n=1 Tax=Ructibacterium gallinarum TaxID=2779355 RepID=A0A9D5LYL4_9FIRM|nr:preprotein translocase subunit YajC [Ructibacterium gallinarum]MBE5040396.1 preprotein translocase subunit YajC [Ructibacterium gallinarum]